MRAILLPADRSPAMASALVCAKCLGQSFSSQIDGLALRPIFTDIVAPDPIVAVPLPPAQWNEAEFTLASRQDFESYFSDEGIARAGRSNNSGVSYNWRHQAAIDDAALGSLSRVYDITVIGRPGAQPAGPRLSSIEAVLFDGGRPVLIAPPRPPTSLGQSILIAWNQSTETARAVALALPLLRRAKAISILTVSGGVVPGPSGSELQRYLAKNDIIAETIDAKSRGRRSGEAILQVAGTTGADLIVKGAYTTSRLRQMIFGGATSHLLSAAELPVFMAS